MSHRFFCLTNGRGNCGVVIVVGSRVPAYVKNTPMAAVASAEDALACYDRVVATRALLLNPMPFTAPSGKFVMEETLFLPLSEDGANVSKILVYFILGRV